MKRKITLLAFVLVAVFTGLIKSDSMVNAEPPQRFVFDTGIIDLDLEGERDVLQITVATGAGDDAVVQFRQMNYTESSCTEGVCKQIVSSQTASAPVSLRTGEAASFTAGPDTQGNHVRIVILSNSRNVRVNVLIIDSATGEVVAFQKHWEIIA